MIICFHQYCSDGKKSYFITKSSDERKTLFLVMAYFGKEREFPFK